MTAGIRRGHVWRAGVHGTLAASLLAASAGAAPPTSLLPPVMAPPKPARPAANPQSAPAAEPVPSAQPVPIAAPAAPPPVVVPRLSEAQARQLAELLAQNAVAQGLQEKETPLSPALSNEDLVRAAVDQ